MRVREQQRSWLAVVLLGLVLVRSAQDVEAAPPQVSELEAAMRGLGTAIENDLALGGENLEKLRSNGQCEGRYSLTPNYRSVGMVAWSQFKDMSSSLDQLLTLVRPITDIEETLREKRSELDSLKSQIEGSTQRAKAVGETLASAHAASDKEMTGLDARKAIEQTRLTMIQQGQREAVRDWLLRAYGNIEVGSKTAKFDSGREAIRVVDVLFGTFISSFPRSVRPGEDLRVTVVFHPATFLERLFKTDVEVGPTEKYSNDPPEALKLKPATFQDDTGPRPFHMGERRPVTAQGDLVWTWAGKVDKTFQRGAFGIPMEARLTGKAAESSGQKVVAILQIEIEREHEQPWYEKNFLNWLIPLLMALIVSAYSYYRVRKSAQEK